MHGLTWHVDPAAPPGGDGSAPAPFVLAADAMAAAAAGDTVRLAAGVHTATVPVTAYGQPRLALLELKDGVAVVGDGREATILRAVPAEIYTFGIVGVGVGAGTSVSDLTVDGACFQGVNLRSASPVFRRLDLVNDVTGGSSVACDVRDASFPVAEDVRFDGGHTSLVVEFGSGGTYDRCTIGIGPYSGLLCNDAAPVFTACRFEGAGRDVIVLTAGSQPELTQCFIGAGSRFVVWVTSYPAGSEVDLGGNTWFSDDPAAVLARIRDARVDPTLGATVLIEPLLNGGVALEKTSFGDLKARFR